jgi:hypothetical protein
MKFGGIAEDVSEVAWVFLVRLMSADVSCGKATLRTSPSSGQATTSPWLRLPKPLACHSRTALGAQLEDA